MPVKLIFSPVVFTGPCNFNVGATVKVGERLGLFVFVDGTGFGDAVGVSVGEVVSISIWMGEELGLSVTVDDGLFVR
jgi:hypothetical protein